MTKPGHPVLIDAVASITEETLKRKARNDDDEDSDGVHWPASAV